MLDHSQTLHAAGVKNNQQVMAIVPELEADAENGVYDKLKEARKDAEKLLHKGDSYMDVSLVYLYICFYYFL